MFYLMNLQIGCCIIEKCALIFNCTPEVSRPTNNRYSSTRGNLQASYSSYRQQVSSRVPPSRCNRLRAILHLLFFQESNTLDTLRSKLQLCGRRTSTSLSLIGITFLLKGFRAAILLWVLGIMRV